MIFIFLFSSCWVFCHITKGSPSKIHKYSSFSNVINSFPPNLSFPRPFSGMREEFEKMWNLNHLLPPTSSSSSFRGILTHSTIGCSNWVNIKTVQWKGDILWSSCISFSSLCLWLSFYGMRIIKWVRRDLGKRDRFLFNQINLILSSLF